ncbi:MAG TPA: hypothetical protein VKJ01_01345 [Candidatus Solibacter sp.]|nr:hypothetical protein [Candidatus Solibacter sp.]
MNARTCQLCSKPLSRLRADGDFCSKEHRNQYRLRAGMNRLQEANKVSSLMRRRENPRQIGTAQLICNSNGAARVCDPPRLLSTQVQPGQVQPPGQAQPGQVQPAAARPVFSIAGEPHMPNAPQGYRDSAPNSIPGISNPRQPNGSRIRIGTNQQVLALPKRSLKIPAALVRADISQLRAASPDAKPHHRPMERLGHGKIRVNVGWGPALLRRGDAPGKVSLNGASRTCDVRTASKQGKALRVSTAIGFRAMPAHLRRHASQPTMCNALVWPGRPYSTTPDSVSRPAAPKLFQVGIPAAGAICPDGPSPARSTRFGQAKIVAVPPGRPAKGSKPPTKFCGVAWNPVDPRWAGKVPGPESAGFARRNGAHLFALPLQPFTIDTLCHSAAAPIQAREGPVGYPKLAIQDTLAGAILSPGSLSAAPGSLPADTDENDENDTGRLPAITPVQKRFEENFDSGWTNWSGGTADWKVDIAGVRTGSLALFSPSMDMLDYELEFLTRIDHRTVTWVIRAANPNEYCRCTLTVAPSGELEFSRGVRFEGVAEAAFTAAGRIAAKPKSAITVRTRVQGQAFTVTVNGTPIDTWTDTRLPIGGIGFIGTPEDRARLYWIRLSTNGSPGTGSPGKEYRKP